MKCKKIANDIDKLRNINIKFSLSNKTYYTQLSHMKNTLKILKFEYILKIQYYT